MAILFLQIFPATGSGPSIERLGRAAICYYSLASLFAHEHVHVLIICHHRLSHVFPLASVSTCQWYPFTMSLFSFVVSSRFRGAAAIRGYSFLCVDSVTICNL